MGTGESNDTTDNSFGEPKKMELALAAELLYNDYLTDLELTSFSVLDGEDFVT